MAVVVEHEKRRREILDKALQVFIDEGYEDATFQKISDRCGITRTTLYIYFRNKKEIFLWSIKQLTEKMERDITSIVTDVSLSCSERLEEILSYVISGCSENKSLFSVILTYLLQLAKTGKDPDTKVRRRTIRLRHLLSRVVIEGVQKGEFKKTNIKAADDMLYSFVESCIFRLAVLGKTNMDDMKDVIHLAVFSMKA